MFRHHNARTLKWARWFLDWGYVLVFGVIIIAFLVGIIWAAESSQRQVDVCYAAGYTDARRIRGTLYCIGVRDCQSVMVPLEDVRTSDAP